MNTGPSQALGPVLFPVRAMSKLKAMPSRFGGMRPRVAAMPKVADRFYQSPEWAAARSRQPNKWCAICGSTKRLILDHKVERKDGGADFDPQNLEWLCQSHHNTKTADAKARRARGGR